MARQAACLPGARSQGRLFLDEASDAPSGPGSTAPISRHKDPCLKMYTSGTTGSAQGGIVPHTRALYYTAGLCRGVSRLTERPNDEVGACRSITATGGLCGCGLCACRRGGRADRCGANSPPDAFWSEAAEHGATMFNVCRRAVPFPPPPPSFRQSQTPAEGGGGGEEAQDPRGHRQGLRPDVKIGTLCGALPASSASWSSTARTEGNVGFLNLDSKPPAAIGRIPPFLKHRFNADLCEVRYQREGRAHPRRQGGAAIPWGAGRTRWARRLGEIRADDARYTGLTAMGGGGDKEATEKEAPAQCLQGGGDLYFRTRRSDEA